MIANPLVRLVSNRSDRENWVRGATRFGRPLKPYHPGEQLLCGLNPVVVGRHEQLPFAFVGEKLR